MKKTLIVSPDPETAKMLTLVLELRGWEANCSPEPWGSDSRGMDTVILDLVEGIGGLKSADESLRGFDEGTKKVVLLPRGCDRKRAEKQIKSADLLVTRPFHLTRLVEQLLGLAEEDSK